MGTNLLSHFIHFYHSMNFMLMFVAQWMVTDMVHYSTKRAGLKSYLISTFGALQTFLSVSVHKFPSSFSGFVLYKLCFAWDIKSKTNLGETHGENSRKAEDSICGNRNSPQWRCGNRKPKRAFCGNRKLSNWPLFPLRPSNTCSIIFTSVIVRLGRRCWASFFYGTEGPSFEPRLPLTESEGPM